MVGRHTRNIVNIKLAETDVEIAVCYPVMRVLRPHITEGSFVSRVRSQEKSGYKLVFTQKTGHPVAVAGFRLGENLAWGRFLYVDDLVTLPDHRSQGHGAALLSWLKEVAVQEGCEQFHLDSGVQRKDAHRFYEREGMELASFHFREVITPNKALNTDTQKPRAG